MGYAPSQCSSRFYPQLGPVANLQRQSWSWRVGCTGRHGPCTCCAAFRPDPSSKHWPYLGCHSWDPRVNSCWWFSGVFWCSPKNVRFSVGFDCSRSPLGSHIRVVIFRGMGLIKKDLTCCVPKLGARYQDGSHPRRTACVPARGCSRTCACERWTQTWRSLVGSRVDGNSPGWADPLSQTGGVKKIQTWQATFTRWDPPKFPSRACN